MNEMQSFMNKIAPAIAKIDGGCSVCIENFLARCWFVEEYDYEEVVNEIFLSSQVRISKEAIREHIDDEIFYRKHPDFR